MIRIDAAWLVIAFEAAHPHHAYLFTNKPGNRLKVLIHDGVGVCGWRLHWSVGTLLAVA